MSQMQHMSLAGLVFALTPRDLLHDHAAAAAVDAPHPVPKENQKPPERKELEAPLGEMIVSRCRFLASGADGCGTLTWPDGNFDAFLIGTESSIPVNESRKVIALV